MYKVFIKDKPLNLSSEQFAGQELDQVDFEHDKPTISDIESLMDNRDEGYIYGSPNEVLHSLFQDYKWIVAAGGLVKNRKGESLFIKRNGLWDLPKGKLEKGESVEICAIREVEEECGISGLEIVKELSSTFHTYEHKGKKVLKRTYWYEMQTNFDGELIPQEEEGITKVKWLADDKQDKVRKNTYLSILELLNNS